MMDSGVAVDLPRDLSSRPDFSRARSPYGRIISGPTEVGPTHPRERKWLDVNLINMGALGRNGHPPARPDLPRTPSGFDGIGSIGNDGRSTLVQADRERGGFLEPVEWFDRPEDRARAGFPGCPGRSGSIISPPGKDEANSGPSASGSWSCSLAFSAWIWRSSRRAR